MQGRLYFDLTERCLRQKTQTRLDGVKPVVSCYVSTEANIWPMKSVVLWTEYSVSMYAVVLSSGCGLKIARTCSGVVRSCQCPANQLRTEYRVTGIENP